MTDATHPSLVTDGPTERRFETRDGLGLVGDAWGDPAAPPVLLLHGGGQTRHAWGGTARSLATRGWHAVSIDLRGHGESDWSPGGVYGIDEFVSDLRDVGATFAQRPALVGASLGGVMALVAEGERPRELASAVVLVDVAHRIEPEGATRIMEFMLSDLEAGFATLEDAAEAVASYLPQRRPPSDLSGLRKNLRLGDDGRWRWHWDPAFMGAGETKGVPTPGPGRILDPPRLERAARRLAVPTLLVRGRMSDVLSEEASREFLAAAPHARFVDVSDAGHMVAGDRNDAFTDVVVSFLDEHREDAA